MSSERPSETNRIRKIAGSVKGKLSSLLHLSRAPTPSSIEVVPNSDNRTLARISPLNVTPVVQVGDHKPTTAFAAEAYSLSPSTGLLIPVSVPKQIGSTSAPSTHMSAVSRSPLSASSPDSIMQAVTELERNPSTQDSGSGLFSNAQSIFITGNTSISNVQPVNTGKWHIETETLVTCRPNSSPLFVGRNDILDKLQKIFIHCAESNLMSRRSCLLWGTGGIGKTQICLKFIEEMSGKHVFWVDASSVESIILSFRDISSIFAVQASWQDDLVESVLQWISGIWEEWLIVFDNADNLPVNVVEKFIPPGNRGNILITSQNQSMGRVVSSENIIEVHQMEEADAITLLLKASCLDASEEHEKVAKNIVTELGCIPLAVNQAGAYIEAGRCSIYKYLQQFSLHCQTLMTDARFMGASNYDQTVYGTWDLSFSEIKKRASGQSSAGDKQAAHAAILILQICAFYHHSNISKEIFRCAAEESKSKEHMVNSERAEKLPLAVSSLDCTLLALDNNGHWDESIFGQGIAVLLSFSLMRRNESSEMLFIHPLVHCWSREQISKSDQQRIYEMGSTILGCAISKRFSSYHYGLRHLIFLHIKANDSHGSQMGLTKKYYDDKWNNFIFVMGEMGDWKHAEQLGVQALDMRKKMLGTEHPYTLLSMERLAGIYTNNGNFKNAEQLEVQVLDMKKKLLGADDPDTLRSMVNLARTYANIGDFKRSEQLGVQMLDLTTELLGIEHPETLGSMENLARTYSNQGKWNEAEELDFQVLDISKKLQVPGAEHPDTLRRMENLASTYSNQGKWEEAEELEVQVLDITKKHLGAEHPSTLTRMENLAQTYADKGNFKEAEHLYVQVLDLRTKLLGAEHPETLRSIGNLASTYSTQGKWNEAEQLKVQVLDMRKKLLGAEHPDTLMSMANLARTYADKGNFDKAEQLVVQVLGMSKKILGAEHPHTLISMANLATIYANKGRFKDAEQLEVQVLEMRKKLLGAKHPHTLISMGNLARTYADKGDFKEAEQLEVQVLDLRKKLLGAEHPHTLISMGNLVSTYSSQGKWNEAEQIKIQVLDIRKKLLDAEHPDMLKIMANLAGTYVGNGNLKEAEQLEVQVLDMSKNIQTPLLAWQI